MITMEAIVYNQAGQETGKVTLPEHVFAVPWNGDLVHQVVTAMQANARTPIAHAKTRSEVSGTGKKPWKQKGTGSARHGSRRSPLWRTGGVAHGPRNERDYAQKINKKMRTKALYAVLSRKLHDGGILFVDNVSCAVPKTKEAHGILGSLARVSGFEKLVKRSTRAALIAAPAISDPLFKSFRNIKRVDLMETRNLNPVDVLRYLYLVIVVPDRSVETLAARAKESR